MNSVLTHEGPGRPLSRRKCAKLLLSPAIDEVRLKYVSALIQLDDKVAVLKATARCSARYTEAGWDPRHPSRLLQDTAALTPLPMFVEATPIDAYEWMSLAISNAGLVRTVRFTHLILRTGDLVIGSFSCSNKTHASRLEALRSLYGTPSSAGALDYASLLSLFASANRPTRCSLAFISSETERQCVVHAIDSLTRARNHAIAKRRRASSAETFEEEEVPPPSTRAYGWQAWADFIQSAESRESLSAENEALYNLVAVADNPELKLVMADEARAAICSCGCGARLKAALGEVLGSVERLAFGATFSQAKKHEGGRIQRELDNAWEPWSKSAYHSSLSRHALLPNLHRPLAEAEVADTAAVSIVLSVSRQMTRLAGLRAKSLSHDQAALVVAHFRRLPSLTSVHFVDLCCPEDWASTLVAELLRPEDGGARPSLAPNLEELVVLQTPDYERASGCVWADDGAPPEGAVRARVGCTEAVRAMRRLELSHRGMFASAELVDLVARTIRFSGPELKRVTVPCYTTNFDAGNGSVRVRRVLAEAAIGAPASTSGAPYRKVKLAQEDGADAVFGPWRTGEPLCALVERCGQAGPGLLSFEMYADEELRVDAYSGTQFIINDAKSNQAHYDGSATASVLRGLNGDCKGLQRLVLAEVSQRTCALVSEALACKCFSKNECAACSRPSVLWLKLCFREYSKCALEPPIAVTKRLRTLCLDVSCERDWRVYWARTLAACRGLEQFSFTTTDCFEDTQLGDKRWKCEADWIADGLAPLDSISSVRITVARAESAASLNEASEREFWGAVGPLDAPVNLVTLLSKSSMRSFVIDNGNNNNLVTQKWSSASTAAALAKVAPLSKLRRLEIASSASPADMEKIYRALQNGFADLRALSVRANALPVTVADADRYDAAAFDAAASEAQRALADLISSRPLLVHARFAVPVQVRDEAFYDGTIYGRREDGRATTRARDEGFGGRLLDARLSEAVLNSPISAVRIFAIPTRASSYRTATEFAMHWLSGPKAKVAETICDTGFVHHLNGLSSRPRSVTLIVPRRTTVDRQSV